MTGDQLMKIVKQYSQKSDIDYGDVKVIQVADHKTVYVEQAGEDGRAIILSEYQVEGATYWAGYSSRSQTVYISRAA